MSNHVAYVNKQLIRYLPLLPADEVKALLALMLQANPLGYLRTSVETLAAMLGVSPAAASTLLRRLSQKKIIYFEEHGRTLKILVRGFLGGRGAPRDIRVPCG